MGKPTPYDTAVAVPMPEPSQVRQVIGEDFDPAQTLNVLQMFAGTEDFYPALVNMVRAIFGPADIDDRHREMIILRAASVLNAPYEWQANEKMAANAGLTPQEIAAAASDGPVSGIDDEYVLICTAADELYADGTLTDATLDSMLTTFGDTTTRKYIVTIAWFSMLSLILNGCRVPMETTDKIGDRTSPLG